MISSPFLRCLQTAQEACTALGLPGVTTDNRICEVLASSFGVHCAPVVPGPDIDSKYKVNIIQKHEEPLPGYPEDVDDALKRLAKAIN